MAEAPARVWLRQAISDWNCSRHFDEHPGESIAYCQMIAKNQQAVEKAVKAVLAALRDKGYVNFPTRRLHVVDIEVNEIVSAIRRMTRSNQTVDLINHVQTLFNATNAVLISELCALAPKWPALGAIFPRNTEYPFEETANVWIAPSDKSVFSASDTRKFRVLTAKVVTGAGKIVSAAER